tara:strand:- start:34 stop:1662 length:1629 start_codon:yes stop_codon:yes gene_type:complete
MRILLIIVLNNILLADHLKYIPFDFGSQFGYVSKSGALLWNQDWYSNKLLFDGTWLNFPKMYGLEIEHDDFKKNIQITSDSSMVKSYFIYEQGDYLLDKFTLGLNYTNNFRNIKLYGFKRNYSGPYNQYLSKINQPNQQSYILSYDSFKDFEFGGFTIGHFNTYTGIPDLNINSLGLIDNKITSLNLFYNRRYNNIKFKTIIDQFMQRYKVEHSKSFFEGVRYLNRSNFLFGIELFKNYEDYNDYFDFKIKYNSRNVRMNTYNSVDWLQANLIANKEWGYADFGIINLNNQIKFDYKIGINKKINSLKGNFEYSRISQISHPYYYFYRSGVDSNSIYQRSSIKSKLLWSNQKKKAFISFIKFQELENNFLEIIYSNQRSTDNKMINSFMVFECYYRTNLFSLFELEINYTQQDPKGYYSGGYGNWLQFNTYLKTKSFNDLMKIDFILGLNHIGNRKNSSNLNYIEMVPGYDFSYEKLEDINFLNSSISISVSDFIIKYEWKNLTEIILSSINSDENNLISFHSDFQPIVRQVNLSIEWHFQD